MSKDKKPKTYLTAWEIADLVKLNKMPGDRDFVVKSAYNQVCKERDEYRVALEKIADRNAFGVMVTIAREALAKYPKD